jgi:hypothetical protein
MTFPIVYKRGWKGGKSPFILGTTYQRTRPEPRGGRREKGDDQEDFTEKFMFDVSLSLVNSNHWTYRVSGEFLPATSSNELEVFRLFKDEPGMTVSANRPDYESKAVGLDVALTIGQYTIECAKDEVPVNVKLSIKNSNGVCVVTDTVASDKLTYKVVQRTGHTIRSSGGG